MGKKSDRRLRRIQGGFFGAAVGKAEAAAPADGRAGHRKRGRAFRSGHAALKATWSRHLPALHRWRLQRKLFGAAVGKAEAAAPADGRSGHRKRACSIEAAAGME